MPLKVIVGASTKDAARAEFYPSTVAKRVTRIDAWNGSAWKVAQSFVLPMSLSQSPPGTITTNQVFDLELVISHAVTVVVSGGLAPFTYAWTILSGVGVTASSATMATTTFRVTMDPGQSRSGTARCTATDALGTPAMLDVPFSLYNSG